MKDKNNVILFETNTLDGSIKFRNFLYTYEPDFDNLEYHQKVNIIREMREKYEKHMIKIGKRYGFDGKKIIIPSSNGFDNKTQEYFEVKNDLNDKNLLKQKVFSDIILLTKDTKDIAIGYAVSDNPVVAIEDQENGVTVLANCGTSQISDKTPINMLEILKNNFNSNTENLKVYISSNLKKENNKILYKPKSIKNNPEVWKGCIKKSIKEHKGNFIQKVISTTIDIVGYNVDREAAIIKMLTSHGINPDNITINTKDTYYSFDLFSSAKAKKLREESLEGSYLVGAYYPSNIENNEIEQGRTRKLK